MTEDELYADISNMQDEWNKSWRDKRRWIIVEEEDGTYSIHEHMKDGVAPPITKPDARLVAARLLQCLGCGPVAPQCHPEEICVGHIDYKTADIVPFNGEAIK